MTKPYASSSMSASMKSFQLPRLRSVTYLPAAMDMQLGSSTSASTQAAERLLLKTTEYLVDLLMPPNEAASLPGIHDYREEVHICSIKVVAASPFVDSKPRLYA
ncbi:hypothetical protein Dimus_022776 [Dionaea muscipula]